MSAERVLKACTLGLALSVGAAVLGLWLPSVPFLYVGAVGVGVSLVFGLFVLTTPKYTGFLVVGTARDRLLWQPEVWRELTPAVARVIEAAGKGASIVFFARGKNRSSEWTWTTDNLKKFEAYLREDADEYFQHYVYSPSRRSLVNEGGRSCPSFYMRVSQGLSGDDESVSKCTQYCIFFLRAGLGASAEHALNELVATTSRITASPLVGRCVARLDLQDLESVESGIVYRGAHKEELPRLSRMKRAWRPVERLAAAAERKGEA